MDERNSKYELQASRNGLTVPVINGVYLHSIYNPVKEAEAFAKSQENNLKIKNRSLVLGLGFGYHIEEMAKILNKYHKDFEIVIMEPNRRLVEDFIDTRNFEDKNIKIICKDKVKDLFEDILFIEFLMRKPCLIKHDASFILEKEFFTRFLGYQASKEVFHYKSLLTDQAKELFQDKEERTFEKVIGAIKEKQIIEDKKDFILLALDEIRKEHNKGKRYE